MNNPKTLDNIEFTSSWDIALEELDNEEGAEALPFDTCSDITKNQLREEAIKILKKNKEINTADWIEFFNIEKEFADECLNNQDVIREKDGVEGEK